MNIQKKSSTDNSVIEEVKAAINTRKYAHVDEINVLWQHALRSTPVIKWEMVILISAISGLIITAVMHL